MPASESVAYHSVVADDSSFTPGLAVFDDIQVCGSSPMVTSSLRDKKYSYRMTLLGIVPDRRACHGAAAAKRGCKFIR